MFRFLSMVCLLVGLSACVHFSSVSIPNVEKTSREFYRLLTEYLGPNFFEHKGRGLREYRSVPFIYSKNKIARVKAGAHYKLFITLQGAYPYTVRIRVMSYSSLSDSSPQYAPEVSRVLSRSLQKVLSGSPENHDLLDGFRTF